MNTRHLVLFAALGLLSACRNRAENRENPAPALSSQRTPAPTLPAPPPPIQTGDPTMGDTRLLGPELVILPGKGLTAIRFGATFATLERLMESPCELRTENRCVYVNQGVDFTMKDGAVSGISVYRRDRKVQGLDLKELRLYGTFHGFLPKRIVPGLLKEIVEEEYGKPLREEKIDPPGPEGQMARSYYEGLVFEFDRLKNGKTALSKIEIVPTELKGKP